MNRLKSFALTLFLVITVISVGPCLPGTSHAFELGHYAPSMLRNRDFVVPQTGFYYIQYNMYYNTDTFRDRNGDKVDSVNIGGVNIDIDADVDSWMIVPSFAYVTDREVLGARYGLLGAIPFGNASVQAALETSVGFGLDVDESSFGLGDIYIRPVWLGWEFRNLDFSAGYAFYAPTGKYDAGEDTNVGLGMWTHEFQAAGTWYLDEQKGTALTLAGTYEIHHEKEDVDITPGSHFSLNYGLSQFLPLGANTLGELGATGYSQWQVTEDSGSDARNKDVKDMIHAIGIETGLVYIPWDAQCMFRWLHEYNAENRFEGDFYTLTIAKSF